MAWENSDSESLSDEDLDQEEESNICFMADYESDTEFEKEPIEVKYDLLLDAFQEIHVEAMRLQYKVNRLNSERKDYEYRINNLVSDNEKLQKELDAALLSVKTIIT